MSPPVQSSVQEFIASTSVSEEVRASEIDPAETLPWLPCMVSLEIPLQRFTIADLSKLAPGSVVSSACPRNSDVPLYVNGQLIGWTELEVIDDGLAVRITEIA